MTGGIGGLSAGFPLALYMFIGWENGPALAEECRDPRTTVPRALTVSIAIATVLFLLFAYATVTGFGYDVSSIGRSSIPFLTVADRALGPFAVVAWVAGIVSVLATLVSGSNSQSRMLYDAGRTGKLPRWLGVVRPETGPRPGPWAHSWGRVWPSSACGRWSMPWAWAPARWIRWACTPSARPSGR